MSRGGCRASEKFGDQWSAGRAVVLTPGEEILHGNGRRFRSPRRVLFEVEDEWPFVGLLQAEAV